MFHSAFRAKISENPSAEQHNIKIIQQYVEKKRLCKKYNKTKPIHQQKTEKSWKLHIKNPQSHSVSTHCRRAVKKFTSRNLVSIYTSKQNWWPWYWCFGPSGWSYNCQNFLPFLKNLKVKKGSNLIVPNLIISFLINTFGKCEKEVVTQRINTSVQKTSVNLSFVTAFHYEESNFILLETVDSKPFEQPFCKTKARTIMQVASD